MTRDSRSILRSPGLSKIVITLIEGYGPAFSSCVTATAAMQCWVEDAWNIIVLTAFPKPNHPPPPLHRLRVAKSLVHIGPRNECRAMQRGDAVQREWDGGWVRGADM